MALQGREIAGRQRAAEAFEPPVITKVAISDAANDDWGDCVSNLCGQQKGLRA